IMKFLILLLFATSALALKPHTAIYTLSTVGLEIAEARIALTEIKGVYTYTLDAQTADLIALIKDYQIRSKSTFTINKSALQSQHFQNFERDGNRVKKDIDIYLTPPQVDPLNQTLAAAHILSKNPHQKSFDLLLNNGKTVENKHYQQIANQHKNLISIISSDGNTEVHFDKNKYFLPVLIRNKKFSYQLKSIQF
ncbi:MAG: DUF3108 domain-containing protein, partial [Candidatus Thioglobus sp.]